jgi:hypothetical protein
LLNILQRDEVLHSTRTQGTEAMQRVAWRLACYQASGRKATVTNNNPPAREQHAARYTVLCLPLGVRKWILTLLWQRQDRTPNQF